ncbi:MAG: AmpG family muropeptide MFS transporter [Alphaproteobacteria bacterium]
MGKPEEMTEPVGARAGALGIYLERRTLVMLVLGFASGLPFLLIFDTLSAWLREAGLSLGVIGFFSLATLAYAFKFLWAPLVDRAALPGLTRLLGHRRSWMIVCQGLIMVGLWTIAGLDPAVELGRMALAAVAVGFAGATQDIVMDAWRIEAADASRQGAMAAAYQWGYRIAMVVAGAAPLILAEHFGWSFSYAAMAALMGIGVLGVLAAPREAAHAIRPLRGGDVRQSRAATLAEWLARLAILGAGAVVLGSGLAGDATLIARALEGAGAGTLGQGLAAAWHAGTSGILLQVAAVAGGLVLVAVAAWPIPGVRTRPGLYLGAAFGEPLADFFGRFARRAGLILALICLYRVADFVLNIMNPFYLDLGYTKVEVAEVRKVFGVVVSMLGIFAGGYVVARFGLMRALVVGAFAGPASNLVFAWLTAQGPSLAALYVAIGIDNLASGFAGTVLIAYMSSLTSIGFTATQYALFSSLYALPGRLIASQSGRIVEAAAQSAQLGGALAPLKGFLAGMPADAFAAGAARAAVSPVALGAGYVAFFLYSTGIGLFAVVLAILVARAPRAPPAG